MLDAKIQMIVDRFGDCMGAKVSSLKEDIHTTTDSLMEEFDKMSRYMKLAVAVSLGLSIADTVLLFAILKKID